MQTKEPMWWPQRAVPATEANKLSLSIQRYNSSISTSSICPKFDLKLGLRLHLWNPLTSGHRLEQRRPGLHCSSDVCWSSIKERCTTGQLLWFYRWDCSANFKTLYWAKSCVQSTQESAWTEISVCYLAQWINWQYLWTSRWVLNLHRSRSFIVQVLHTKKLRIVTNFAKR